VSIGDVTIERGARRDAPVLAELGRTTFAETYSDQTSPTDMREHLADAYSLDQMDAELADPDSTFFVARVGDAVAGYLKLNRGQAQTELREATGLEIERLYVLKAYQGQGIGKLLLDKALDEARTASVDYLWLGVWERNARARRFWTQMGFVESGSHAFRFGGVEHRDLMMRRQLEGCR
jgi:GNAT superfamily N-acetyltransferase